MQVVRGRGLSLHHGVGVAVAGFALAAAVMGGAADDGGTRRSGRQLVGPSAPVGFDDAHRAFDATDARHRASLSLDRDAGNAPPATIPLSTHLAGFAPVDRLNARIEIEFGAAADGHRALGAQAEDHWDSGDHESALRLLRVLESMGVAFDVGVAWKRPRGLGGGDGADVPLGAGPARGLAIDYDARGGNLLATIERGGSPAGWTLNISTDRGSTWQETYAWITASRLAGVDAVVADGYMYIAYLPDDDGTRARVRRGLVTDGSIDVGFSARFVFTASGGSDMADVALASNIDDLNDRVYCFVIEAGGRLRYAVAASTDGTVWTERPTGVTNAASGLSATWDHNFTCEAGRFVSFFNTGGDLDVCASADDSLSFDPLLTIPNALRSEGSSITAYGDAIFVAYGLDSGGIGYHASRDCGLTWSPGTLRSGNGYGAPSITARGGWGTAVVYCQEAGEPDALWIQSRRGYGSGPWSFPVRANEHDVVTGAGTDINYMSPVCDGDGFGLAYVSSVAGQTPFFDGKCVNDDCADATPIGGHDDVSGNLTFATNDVASQCGASALSNDVWYLFSASREGHLLVTTCGTNDTPAVDMGMNTVLAVFRGCNGVQLTCDDDWDSGICEEYDTGARRDSAVRVCTQAGALSRIRVSHYGNQRRDGAFELHTFESCRGDTNFDGTVNGLDLLNVLTNWGGCGANPICTGDTNCDGAIDVFDILEVIENRGPC